MSAAEDLGEAIALRADACGITLAPAARAALARHASAVLAANERLHLTAITDPDEFLERHIGEAFEGANLLPADVSGVLLDIGSGNGYPALPLAAARPGLRPVLIEASAKKAEFLTELVREPGPLCGEVLHRHVQRAADLEGVPAVRVLTARAVGGWFRLLPKLVAALEPVGVVLLWAGAEVETVRRRVAWRKLRLVGSHVLPGATRSTVWMFAPTQAPAPR